MATRKVVIKRRVCAWPQCGERSGLVAFVREWDKKTFYHCGRHHYLVVRLAKEQKNQPKKRTIRIKRTSDKGRSK